MRLDQRVCQTYLIDLYIPGLFKDIWKIATSKFIACLKNIDIEIKSFIVL